MCRQYSPSISCRCEGTTCGRCRCWSEKPRSNACSRTSHRVRYLQHVNEHGEALYRHFEQLGLEGVVGKRADAPYKAGRSDVWKKVKTPAFKAIEAKRLEHIRK